MRSRFTRVLSDKLKRNPLVFLAAVLVGIGIMAFPGQAHARVIFTPAHVVIGNGGVDSYSFDMDGDGFNDYTIRQFIFTFQCDAQGDRATFWLIQTLDFPETSVAGTDTSAAALSSGVRVDASLTFGVGGGVSTMASYWKGSQCEDETGNWDNVANHFLGLRFQIGGETHYGWARLSVQHVPNSGFTATLTGWAYQTVANRGLVTGFRP